MTASSEAAQIVRKIVSSYKPLKVFLFGSVARGKQRPDSDIDLLIIKDTPLNKPHRIKEVFQAVRGIARTYPLDPIVYTPQEIQARIDLGDQFITSIFSEGKLMHG